MYLNRLVDKKGAHKQSIKGGALLTALFIMTLVAIVATAMSARLQLDLYNTQLLITYDKLYLATEEISFWAYNQLQNKNYPLLEADKALIAKFPKKINSSMELNGALYDAQAGYNLNNLLEKKTLKGFINFLKQSSKLNITEQLNLALAINHWLTDYDPAQGKDDFTSYYLAQKPAYYPSHQLMTSVSELRLVKGVSANLVQSLSPFIVVLPEKTPININTASKKVLMSLGAGLNEVQVKDLLAARGKKGIKNQQELNELIKKMDLPNEDITLISQYFLCVATAKLGEFKLTTYTLLKRDSKKPDKITVSIIKKSLE